MLSAHRQLATGPFGGRPLYSDKVAYVNRNVTDEDEQDLWLHLFDVIETERERHEAEEQKEKRE